ncbi:hypothetical protein [Paenibacillus turpanensis]|uniref:hypothetical protein n=1 Tax=Paenibacillus turpanensis TaxID=2689078 RepID=UPI00140A50BD|nr:hypothetical protein [Paenibacillus turpanensis]
MEFCMKYGDTNFIGLVNAEKYKAFVDEDWEFEQLLQHFREEMKDSNILVFQMTTEGIEHSWTIEVLVGATIANIDCYRRSEGYITVTEGKLFLVDYDCLTMSAQFKDEKIPDENCEKYLIELNNGVYKVEIIQFYNVDQGEHIGSEKVNMLINFIEVRELGVNPDKLFWCSYI